MAKLRLYIPLYHGICPMDGRHRNVAGQSPCNECAALCTCPPSPALEGTSRYRSEARPTATGSITSGPLMNAITDSLPFGAANGSLPCTKRPQTQSNDLHSIL